MWWSTSRNTTTLVDIPPKDKLDLSYFKHRNIHHLSNQFFKVISSEFTNQFSVSQDDGRLYRHVDPAESTIRNGDILNIETFFSWTNRNHSAALAKEIYSNRNIRRVLHSMLLRMLRCLDYLDLKAENDYRLNNQWMTAEYKGTTQEQGQGGKNGKIINNKTKKKNEWP